MATDHKYTNTKSCAEVETTSLKKQVKALKQEVYIRKKN